MENTRQNHSTKSIAESARRRSSPFRRMAFFPLAIFYMEVILRLWSNQPFWGRGLLYTFLFSVGAGLVINIVISIGSKRLRRILSWTGMIILTVLFISQVVFYTIFRSYSELSALAIAPAAISNFFLESLQTIAGATLPVLLLLLPIAVFQALWLWKRLPIRFHELKVIAILTVVLHGGVIASILFNTSGLLPLRAIYRENFTVNLGTEHFGLVTSMRLDLGYMIFGRPEADLSGMMYVPHTNDPSSGPGEAPPSDAYHAGYAEGYDEGYEAEPRREIPTGYNVLDIDFEALIANETNAERLEMHNFFANRRATPRGEFTGLFEGKNLIWIVAEAFHTVALHPEITPTLYRLSNEGFIFPNFYTPDTGFSTTGGEFATLISLIPRHRDDFPNTARNYMPFGFGNMFRDLGYVTFAYHNHTHNFYRRDLSHPNLGYEWIAIGSGLYITSQWPRSDIEMAQATVDDFIHNPPFHVYYMTVSGHLEYNFGGNAMARKHQDAVAHLPYSTGPRAYLATHIELDLMIQYLIDRLDRVGQLENTVFAVSADHWPNGLSLSEMSELAGFPITCDRIDVHHSTFLLWSASMTEPIVVEAYSSFYDVMPTLANLFNLPFDSRLVMGTDLLSGVEPLVTFANRSWISHLGRFNSLTREFTPHPHVNPADIPENHAQQMSARFNAMEVHSSRIITHDYYRIVLGNR